jgi:carboxymethylenebutenolidase
MVCSAWTPLLAADGHRLNAWVARPQANRPAGAVVVLQEIFGVNGYIRSVCERLADQGWLAIAPALFDRAQPGLELDYGPGGVASGRAAKEKVSEADALRDVQAAIEHVRPAGQVAVLGFCWGGTLAWLAAARLQGVSGAVAYYGTNIHGHIQERPRVPVLMHFGDQDTHIPPQHVQDIATAWPQMPLYRYGAGHGFHCDARPAFEPASARLAGDRTQSFLERHLC